MNKDDIKLIMDDFSRNGAVTIEEITKFGVFLYILDKYIKSIHIDPITLLLWSPMLLKSGHMTGDFLAGIFHYTLDTFNIPGLETEHDNFRKHHKDVMSIEQCTWAETITEIMPLSTIFLQGNLCLQTNALMSIYSIIYSVIGCSSQVAHRLAHRRTHEYAKDGTKQFYIPDFVKWLQDNEIILSHKHHSKHHRTEVMNYCIANGSTSRIFDEIIDIFDLPVSTYCNSKCVHTTVSKKTKNEIIKNENETNGK